MPINRTCLHAFHIVASSGGYSLAAVAHHISQPTLSAQVKELEERYKTSLFERKGRTIILTHAGKSLLEITNKLYELENEAERFLLAGQSKTTGTLRIGADSPFLIIPLMKQFQQDYPDVKLHIDFGNSKHLQSGLRSRTYDLILLPQIKSSKDLYCRHLRTDHLIAFVNFDHRWSKRRSIKLSDLVNQAIVLREKGSNTRSRFETIIKRRGIKLDANNITIIGSREGVGEAVAVGFGIGIVAMSEFGHDQRLHPLIIRDLKSKQIEYLACQEARKTENIIKLFFDSFTALDPSEKNA